MLRYRGSVHLEGVFIWGVISSTDELRVSGCGPPFILNIKSIEFIIFSQPSLLIPCTKI